MAIQDMPPALQRALAHKQRMAIAWRPNPTPTPTPIAVAPRRTPTSPASAITMDDAALNEWADGLTARVGLQSELVWVGLNDGYVDAGGKDVAIPYLGLYWLLGAAKRSCVDCPPIAMGSPYDPPGKGPNPIYQSPGDGHTQCGAGCKCWLEYGLPAVSTPKNYAWSNNVFPGPGKATPEIAAERDTLQMRREAANYSWREAMVLDPQSEYFTDGQKGALDLFRAKWLAWEDVRGTLPQAPQMFAEAEDAQSLQDLDMFWNSLTDQQEKILIDLQEAIGAWNAATAEANAALADGAIDQQLTEMGDDNTIALFGGGFFGGFHGGGESAGGARGHGSFGGGMIHTVNGERGVLRDPQGHLRGSQKGGWVHKGGGGRRGFGGEHEGERGGGKRVSGEAESRARRSPNEGASRRVLRGKVNDSERTSRLATLTKRTGSAEKSPNEGAVRRTNAVKTKATGEKTASKSASKTGKPSAAPKSSTKAAKAPKPVKSPEEKLVAQRTTQLAKAKSAETKGYQEHLSSTSYGGMEAFRMPKSEWFGPEGPHANTIKAAELNLAHAQALAKGETAWKGAEQSTPFSKSEFLHATLKPMNARLQGHNPGFTTKIGETTYHVKLVQHDDLLANETFIPHLKGSENATYQAHAEQAATEIGHLLGVGNHMVDAHSFQVGSNHFVATKFQTGMKPVGDQEKGATPAREAALFKSLGAEGAGRLVLHEYLTGNGDIHAGNVLMSAKTGEVKLLDFGRSFTQPGALMQGLHAPTRPISNGWARAVAAKLGIKTSGNFTKTAAEQGVYKAMHLPREAVQHALTQESKVIGILKAHGLDAAVRTTQARFNVLKQLGDDTSIQHFDELQTKAFVDESRAGVVHDNGAVDFSESSDDAIQLWGIGGALRAAFGGKGALGGIGGHFADGREVLRGRGGKFNGSTKGAGHEKTSSSRGHKGEEERSSSGRGHKAQEQERVKSPNERANRRMSRGERKAAEKAATEHAAKAKSENDAKLAAFKQTHDDSPLAREMPFTRAEFLAQGTGGQTLRGGRMAETRLTTINGERYVVKRLVGGYQREEHDAQGNVVDRESPYGAAYREAKAEVAGGHIAKMVGLGESVAHDAFVLTHNGQLYSIQTFEHGSPLTRLSNSEHAKFDEANKGAEGEQRMLTEYLVGRVDGHGGNYLYNSATGGVKIIDFGNDFTPRTFFNPLQTMIGRSVLATRGGRTSERDSTLRPKEMKSIKLDKVAIHAITSHASAIRTAIAKFNFDEEPAFLTRLAQLEKLDTLEAPTMHDFLLITGGREVPAALGGTKYEGLR